MLPFESKFTAPDFVTELILVRRTLLGIFLEFLLSFTTVLINKIFEPAVFGAADRQNKNQNQSDTYHSVLFLYYFLYG